MLRIGWLGLLCGIAAAQPVIVSGPVADAITPTSARITWVTNISSSTMIHFGLSTAYGAITKGFDSTIHSWYLSGLKPGTQYHFKVCSAAGAEVCSSNATVTTLTRPAGLTVSQPTAPRDVNTSMPAGAYGPPLYVNAACSNLPAIMQSLALLTGSLHYEVRIPAGTNCRGQFVFPERPAHSGWIVVRSAAPDSAFAVAGTRVAADSTSGMARMITDALPGTRSLAGNLATVCSVGALAWTIDVPGMALFVCEPQGSSTAKTITGATYSGTSPVTFTSPGHGYKTGNLVKITGTGLSVDNKFWAIKVVDTNRFSLNSSTGSGTFRSNGSAKRSDAWTQPAYTAGTTVPSNCAVNGWFFKTNVADPKEAAYWCTSPNTWTNVHAIVTHSAELYAAIQFAPNAKRYRFVGLEITHIPMPNPPPASWSQRDYKQGQFGALVAVQVTNRDIIFDRVDIHGLDYPSRVSCGVHLNGSDVAIIDSRIHKINRWAEKADGVNLEAFAVYMPEGPGPGKIENNFLQAIGITVFFPGVKYHNTPPADYTIRRNDFSHPEMYLYGSASNTSRKNYTNRHHLELKAGRRMLIEGNTFDTNWADVNQGAFIMLTPRPGSVPAAKTITGVLNGRFTVSSSTDPYTPGMLVSISGTGAGNHDGIRQIATVPSPNTFTLVNPPSGAGSTGRVTAAGSDIQIADLDIRNNIFRHGPNVMWITGHQDNESNNTLNTKTTARVRFANNLVYGMDARSYSAGGYMSAIGTSANGRSGLVIFAARGMEDLIVRNNTVYDFKGNNPTFLQFDNINQGAHGGLDLSGNIFTANSPVISTISGAYTGTQAFNRQWTQHPNASWTVTGNVFCCGVSEAVKASNPPGNSWAATNSAIGFANPAGADFRLLPSSPFKAGNPGVNMDILENATK